MPDLFGLDIAGIINSAIVDAGGVRTGVLTRSTPGARTPGSATAGTNPTTATYNFNGFVETETPKQGGTAINAPMAKVTILGASLSIVPAPGDIATIDGVAWKLVELMVSDPAAATYEFRAEN